MEGEGKETICPCKRTDCERYGDCVACKEHHHTSKRKILTACDRVKQKEERKQQKEERKHTRVKI